MFWIQNVKIIIFSQLYNTAMMYLSFHFVNSGIKELTVIRKFFYVTEKPLSGDYLSFA